MRLLVLLLSLLHFPLLATCQLNIEDSLSYQGFTRYFTVHLPPGYSPSGQAPVVIFLHGGSGDRLSAQGFTRLNLVSNANGFLAVYPEGKGSTAIGGFSWADGRGTEADLMGIDDVGFIDQMLDSLAANYGIDTTRIYLCGFSNGGFMTQRIACENNSRFAAVATLGATQDSTQFAACNPGRPLPFCYILGTEDPFVTDQGGNMLVSGQPLGIVGVDALRAFWAQNNACTDSLPRVDLPDIDLTDNSTVSLFRATNCDCMADVAYYRVIGAGHTWPGVENTTYEQTAGETNEDINASQELWNFFSAYALCGGTTTTVRPTGDANIRVFPNPATTWLRLVAEARIQQVTLVNSQGVRVHQATVQAHTLQLDVQRLPAGLYCLQVALANGATYSQWVSVVR